MKGRKERATPAPSLISAALPLLHPLHSLSHSSASLFALYLLRVHKLMKRKPRFLSTPPPQQDERREGGPNKKRTRTDEKLYKRVGQRLSIQGFPRQKTRTRSDRLEIKFWTRRAAAICILCRTKRTLRRVTVTT